LKARVLHLNLYGGIFGHAMLLQRAHKQICTEGLGPPELVQRAHYAVSQSVRVPTMPSPNLYGKELTQDALY